MRIGRLGQTFHCVCSKGLSLISGIKGEGSERSRAEALYIGRRETDRDGNKDRQTDRHTLRIPNRLHSLQMLRLDGVYPHLS